MKKYSNYLILILLGFQLVPSSTMGQLFSTFTTADGLASDNVNCLVVDGNNELWFGTQKGVSHFDGTTWTTHDVASDSGIIDNNILAIEADDLGNIWIGTDFGAGKYDGTNWYTITTADGLEDNRIKHIKEDLAGNIWFGNNDGVTIYDGSTWSSYTQDHGLPFGGVAYVGINPNGDIWLGTDLGGVFIFNGTSFSEITEDEGLLDDAVRTIAFDAHGNKWIGTAGGISIFDTDNNWVNNHTRPFVMPAPDTLNPIEDLAFDSQGRLWASIYVNYLVTEGGISSYESSTWSQYEDTDGLAGPVVRRIAVDTNDDVWVTTSTGVTKISSIPTSTDGSLSMNSSAKLFPNPAKTYAIFEVANAKKEWSAELVDLFGKSVKPLIFRENNQFYLNLDNQISKGVYFVRVDTENGIITKKLLIN